MLLSFFWNLKPLSAQIILALSILAGSSKLLRATTGPRGVHGAGTGEQAVQCDLSRQDREVLLAGWRVAAGEAQCSPSLALAEGSQSSQHMTHEESCWGGWLPWLRLSCSPKTSPMGRPGKGTNCFYFFSVWLFFLHLYSKIKTHLLPKKPQTFEEYKKQDLEWELKHKSLFWAFPSLPRNLSEPSCYTPVTQHLDLDGWSEAGLQVC